MKEKVEAPKGLTQLEIGIYPGEPDVDYQTGNFLNALNQLVCFFAHDGLFFMKDEDICDALDMYAKQYRRGTE